MPPRPLLGELPGQPQPSVRTRLSLATGIGIAGAGAVLLQLPDFGRFSLLPVLLVCSGSVAFAAAAAMLAAEPEQRANASLFSAAAVLYALEWAFTWPATPLAFLALPFGQLFALCMVVVLLRYPGSRLELPVERRLVAASVVVTIVGHLLTQVTARPAWFAAGIASGRGQLPPSTLWWTVHADRQLSHAFLVITDISQLLAIPVFLVLVVRRLRRESRPVRADLLPVVVGVFVLASVLATHLVLVLSASYRPAAAPDEWVSGLLSLSVQLIPIAFIVGAARRRLARGAVADLVLRLSQPVSAGEIQAALRTAVADDSLEVRYWMPDLELFVDVNGAIVDDEANADSTDVPVTNRSGDLLAHVRVHAAHGRRPELLNAAIAATSLAFENTRLEAALRAQLAEVSASRSRIVQAALHERRRIERDLHDGVQQQLLAVGATLGQLDLRDDLDPAGRQLIDEARLQLRQTRGELRDLAHGLHPSALTESGLASAMSSIAERLPLRLSIDVPARRWPPDVELTAYFVACEAITNCVKHAGTEQAALVVVEEAGSLVVRVSDAGRGGATLSPRGGLAGLRDRARALGGDLTLTSPLGGGTCVEVTLPCG